MAATLKTVKTLLGISDESKDEILKLVIKETEQRILNYCNLNVLPPELRLTAARMTAELYTESRIGEALDDPDSAVVSSVSEGGRTVTLSMSARIASMTRAADEKISKMTELNRFKRLYKLPHGG